MGIVVTYPAVGGGGGGGGGGILATASKNVAADALSGIQHTTAAFVDVDAALSVTFDAPASGSVVILLEAYPHQSGGAKQLWNLRDAGGDVAGTSRWIGYDSTTYNGRTVVPIILTGLTPGNSYTYKWGHRTDTGTIAALALGPTYGPATMIVFAV